MSTENENGYPIDAVNRVKRRADRGFYDHETVHALLDSSALCHVSYVIDGQPFCTPTLFWREASRLYWHGSNSSRMLRNLASGESACLTVTHLDSLILARCGFNHSADYRSVMAFGQARLLEDPEEKRRALLRDGGLVLSEPHCPAAGNHTARDQCDVGDIHGYQSRFRQGARQRGRR